MTDKMVGLRPGRGRRPAAEARAAALEATLEVLTRGSLRDITFDRIAQQGGVSKMTLYKWWPTPAAMAMEAYFASLEVALAFPDTGDIGSDLRKQLRAFVEIVGNGEHGRVMRELVGAAQTDPDLAVAISREYTRPRRDLAVAAINRARDRDQIRPDIDPEVVVDQLWGACYHRLLLPDEPLDARFADTLVDYLIGGIGPRHPPATPLRRAVPDRPARSRKK